MSRVAVGACLVAFGAAAPPDVEAKFREFEVKFGKNYAVSEREARLAIFEDNLQRIDELNQNEQGSATYSHLTPFADLSENEFSARRGYKGRARQVRSNGAATLRTSDLPSDFDWRPQGAVNEIKDQGSCGSCWAFATVANIEGAAFVSTGQLLSLSEQELVDCDTAKGTDTHGDAFGPDAGCDGGLPEWAYADMIDQNLGLELESEYPYKGNDGKCQAEAAKEKAFVGEWTDLSQDEDELAAALMQYGPLALGINAATMQFYYGGVANPSPLVCNPMALDHGVSAVAFGVDGSQKYWTIRNSWGPDWGESGYYRIIRGTGACGLNTAMTTALNVTISDVPPAPTPPPTPTPPAPTPPAPTPPAPTPPAPTPPAPSGKHYGAPPCLSDETEVQTGGGVVCAAPCTSDSKPCPEDHPAGASDAFPQCVLKDDSGVELCGLECGWLGDCPTGASCSDDFDGVCVWPALSANIERFVAV